VCGVEGGKLDSSSSSCCCCCSWSHSTVRLSRHQSSDRFRVVGSGVVYSTLYGEVRHR
jgi:hypothetical protein